MQHSIFSNNPAENSGEKCYICGKSFPNGKNLQLHMMSHNGEKPFYCDLCDKKFPAKNNLTKHKKTQEHIKRSSSQQEGQLVADNVDDKTSDASLPPGWSVREKAAPGGSKQKQYVTPAGEVFNSRREVVEHMETSGRFTEEQIKRAREGRLM